MTRSLATALLAVLFTAALQAEEPKLQTLQGVVGKVEKDAIVVHHKVEKSDKSTTIKLTGTSRFSSLSTRKNGDKIVLVQKDIDAKALVEKQPISLIYATNGGDHVLLTAVVQAE
jgi:hypothetical protein